VIEREKNQEKERERGERKRELEGEVHTERECRGGERVYRERGSVQGDAMLRVRRGSRRRGSRVA